MKNRTEAHLVSEYAQLIAHLQKQAVAIRPVGIMPLRVETYSLKEIIKCIDSLWRCIRRVLIRWKEIKHPDTFFHAFIFYFIIKCRLHIPALEYQTFAGGHNALSNHSFESIQIVLQTITKDADLL